ncbi:Kinesin [Macleaya cordata]|uniref:Kinesin-like protein n=1 Tax=Macleaya cordata TaxID=56857 RepID=A0A200Q4S6_MACCD|nr:Kinesin [Macleaya cordata]
MEVWNVVSEQTLEIPSEEGKFFPDQDQTQEEVILMKDDCDRNHIQETQSSDQEENVNPILQKIDALSSKIMILKKEHMVLSDEVKGVTDGSFPGSDVSAALRLLGTEHETLKKKYLKESSERKRLYNEVIELKGNIRVFCRCRPLNQDEITSGSSSVVEFDPSQDTELQITCSDSSKKHFKFDHVFGPQENQEAVFAQTSPVVTSVLDGFNVCIFAYGQTGTGKTFTMEGTSENRGVNYRTLEELFRISKERSDTMRYELCVSMLEVYNEKIRDLLVDDPNEHVKKLEIKQGAEGTQEVPGLVEARVYSTDEVWEQLKTGSRIRAVGSTNSNELSSRSHCLLRVTVKGESLVNGQRTRSQLWLVDLAGSERVGKTEVEGERLKESQFINKSLSALGDVISALASKTAHIPYRNSKLTHLLQSSLGGDCKTLMFVQISPSSADLGETLCSLNFASRVRGIEHGPARKQADPTELFKYKQMAEKLRQDEKETKKLQDSLQSLQLRFAAREQLCRSLQEKVRDLENQLAEERKTRLQQEARAAASAKSSALSSLQQVQRVPTEKKPPLGPSKLRPPLRGITNFLPPPSPVPPRKPGGALPTLASVEEKENISRTISTSSTKTLMRPRRVSIAVKPSSATMQVYQPKRRVSIATIRPEPHLLSTMTPLNTTNSRLNNGGIMGRRSFARDPRRISKMFSPLRESRSTTVEATPISGRSKFLGSPPTQIGSWKPKHPTVVALQRRHFVWSPLKQKGLKSDRKSLLPSRFSESWK